MNFSEALEYLKQNKCMAREEWNRNNNSFIFLVPGSTFQVNRPPLMGIYPIGMKINYHAHIDIKLSNGQIVPWIAAQVDLLAEDWNFSDMSDPVL